MEVELEWHEYAMAAEIGKLRRLTAVRRSSENSHGATNLSWTEDIEGAAAELVVAKCLGIYWNGGIDTFKKPDLGKDIQVRWTPLHSNSLIVREADPDSNIYILVTGTTPKFVVRGYLYGSEAKNKAWERSPNGRAPAYFVPANHLRPILELGSF
jgi:hypothetical protein